DGRHRSAATNCRRRQPAARTAAGPQAVALRRSDPADKVYYVVDAQAPRPSRTPRCRAPVARARPAGPALGLPRLSQQLWGRPGEPRVSGRVPHPERRPARDRGPRVPARWLALGVAPDPARVRERPAAG